MPTPDLGVPSVADIAETLMAAYEGDLSYRTVTTTVLDARNQMAGQVPRAALPELIYRLADHRLAQLAAVH